MVITSADVQFSSQSQMMSKKKVITPSDCPLYVHHLYTMKVLYICLWGAAALPLDTPLHMSNNIER